jgi:hypothetical protein
LAKVSQAVIAGTSRSLYERARIGF